MGLLLSLISVFNLDLCDVFVVCYSNSSVIFFFHFNVKIINLGIHSHEHKVIGTSNKNKKGKGKVGKVGNQIKKIFWKYFF